MQDQHLVNLGRKRASNPERKRASNPEHQIQRDRVTLMQDQHLVNQREENGVQGESDPRRHLHSESKESRYKINQQTLDTQTPTQTLK